MKIRKTRTDERSTYTYSYFEADKNGKYTVKKTITLRPGENGVTEADIKSLHSLDDGEVYNNNKNIKQTRSNKEKEKIERWKEEYITRITKERGMVPSDDEVEEAVEEQFPKLYHASIDYEIFDGDADKTNLSDAMSVAFEDENPIVERMHEVMAELTDKQREVLILTEFEGRTYTEVAKLWGISVNSIKKHHDKAIKNIEENFYK